MRISFRLLLATVVGLRAMVAAADEAAILRQHGFALDHASWYVERLEDGRPLTARTPDRPLEPASLAKLATAIAAFDVLGREHRFLTELRASGAVVAGRLRGDLALVGGGDPLLEPDHLLELALALRQAGVRRISGRLLLDDGLYPRFARLDPAEPAAVSWNAGVGPLVVGFARVEPVAGTPPFLLPPVEIPWRLEPDLTFPRFAGGILRVPTDPLPRALPLVDPGLAAARLFRRLAADVGVALPPPVRGRLAGGLRLAAHASPPLDEVVRGMLRYSNNQLATMVGLATAARLGPPPRSLTDSATRLVAELSRRHPGLAPDALALRDHAGLDPAGRVTVRGLVRLLAPAFTDHRLAALLPANGWDGTLRRRLRAADLAFRVRAKTGSAAFLVGLAGYLLPADGAPLVFAVVLQDDQRRRAYLADRTPDPARARAIAAWKARARAAVDGLVAFWLRQAANGKRTGTPVRLPSAAAPDLRPGAPPPPPAAPRR